MKEKLGEYKGIGIFSINNKRYYVNNKHFKTLHDANKYIDDFLKPKTKKSVRDYILGKWR